METSLEEIYTNADGVSGTTYLWRVSGALVLLVKSEWTENDLYTTQWSYASMSEFSTYLEGQHAMHLQNGCTHEAVSY